MTDQQVLEFQPFLESVRVGEALISNVNLCARRLPSFTIRYDVKIENSVTILHMVCLTLEPKNSVCGKHYNLPMALDASVSVLQVCLFCEEEKPRIKLRNF